MSQLKNIYPILLLAFSVLLVWLGQLWFSILVFLVSAFCWFGSWINLNRKDMPDEI